MNDHINEINSGLNTAFIFHNSSSDLAYRPEFIFNDPSNGKKVLVSIEQELLNCDEFQISVAFITMGGITPLLQTLKTLENKGIPGKILTTNYLNFSEPEALNKLHSLNNIEIKMYDAEAAETGFHTKGYIFKEDEIYRIIVGSSNLTKTALTSNHEWNTKLISTSEGALAVDILHEFNDLWNSQYAISFDEFYDNYRERFYIIKHQQEIARSEQFPSLKKYTLKPNSMQEEFISNLRQIIEDGEDRALLISATGTGKTFASAFAMREFDFKRVLFLVHRGQLARQTKKSFEMVFDKSVSFGLVGAGYSEYDKDYIFATVQTINRDNHLFKYEPDAFDCIVLDEAHHSSAGTYQKIINYFKPKLFLGMTATPDKRDDNQSGKNIYEIFNYKIAQEIRLQQAMEDNLLCPFHYFGLTELINMNESTLEQNKLDAKDFSLLISDERVNHIIEKAEYFGHSGDRVKGLVFCRRIDESIELSKKFNALGYRTIALNGSASEEERQLAFERLAVDENNNPNNLNPLDYIFSVEILNEGVDIVEVNQVIMLRPTQSPIVFIQQLGRGLRLAKGKEYVVVLDFIGNYATNFMIPIALSGDRTYNKDNIRRYVHEGDRIIPGASTVHFDEISKKRIFESVDRANFSDIKLIKENYLNLKNKLGRIPELNNFDEYGEMDVLRIFDNKSLGSYYAFLKKYEPDYKVTLSDNEELFVQFISKKFASGKRIHELLLINTMLDSFNVSPKVSVLDEFKAAYYNQFGKELKDIQLKNIINIMTNEFPAGVSKKTYDKCIFLEKDGRNNYVISNVFAEMLRNKDFYEIVKELLAFGIRRHSRDYSDKYNNSDLVLYQKYTYEDVCRLLFWEHGEVPQNIGGYKYDKTTKTFPIFINYDKSDDIKHTIKYEDRFINSRSLVAISKSNRTIESSDVQNFIKSGERNIEVELFVRKNKDDKISKEFYYLGQVRHNGFAEQFVMDNTTSTAVEIGWTLDVPVREDIYDYIVKE